MTRKIIFLLSLLLSSGFIPLIAQGFIPKQGEIAFVKEISIYDKIAFETSINVLVDDFAILLKKQVIKEKEMNFEEVDENEIDMLIGLSKSSMRGFFKKMYTNEKVYNYHKYQDSLIISYRKVDNHIVGNYRAINKNTGEFYTLSKLDSTSLNSPKAVAEYREELNPRIEEYKDVTKTINGFNCFKVVFTVSEKIDDIFEEEEYDVYTTYVLYVTDEIRAKFHPVFDYETVLEKYYPLEISETLGGIEGVETTYTLDEFTLN